MYTNGNLEAHVAALLLLGSIGCIVQLCAASVLLFFARRNWSRYPLFGIVGVLVGYGILLVGFSLFSHDRTLARGEEKHFCELDCHVAYSIQDIQHAKSIGNTSAQGEFVIATVRSRFDEQTIAPRRPHDAPLIPGPVAIAAVSPDGRRFQPSAAGQVAWQELHGHSHSRMDCLRPAESYTTTVVFDLPLGLGSPRLLLTALHKPSVVLIGDEDSPWHRKTYLGL